MNSSSRIVFFMGALSCAEASLSGRSRGEIAPEQTVCMHVHDQARVPAAVLRSATEEASRIFRAAGIKITWERHPADAPEAWISDMSARPRNADDRDFVVLRLARGTPSHALSGALGFALPLAPIGVHVFIFYDRVEALQSYVSTPLDVRLGHAMAHEIGHVLLRSSEHSGAGLMQARWTPTTWRLASAGLLAFSREEATRMADALHRYRDPNLQLSRSIQQVH